MGGFRQPKRNSKKSNKRVFYFSDPARAHFVAETLDLWNRHIRWSNKEGVAMFIETNATKQEIMRIGKGFTLNWKEKKPIGFGMDFEPKMIDAEPLPVEPENPPAEPSK